MDTLTVYTAEMDSDTVEMDSDTVKVDTDGRWTRRRRTRDTGGGHGGVGHGNSEHKAISRIRACECVSGEWRVVQLMQRTCAAYLYIGITMCP